jgi:hypothetical protein
MRLTKFFEISLPKEAIDLYRWMTEMTDADYVSYARAHKAMGSYFKDGRFCMTNVETIGNEMIVQNYVLQEYQPDRIKFYSDSTKAYVLRWFPAVVGVPWEMEVRAKGFDRSELVCTIGADFPNQMIAICAYFNGLGGLFLRKHLQEEGKAFARDIERKFGSLPASALHHPHNRKTSKSI